MSGADILRKAAQSASYNMILQLTFRLLTFVLNAFTLHYVSRDMLGVVNVRLLLLYTTILFLAREAFRRACLSKSAEDKWPQVINLVWCSIPIGILFSGVLSVVWLWMIEVPDPHIVPHYHTGVLLFAISAIIELLSEPLYIVAQVLLYVKLKVLVEGIALACRCLVIVTLLLISPQLGILIFGIAQILLAVLTVVGYYGYFTYHISVCQTKKDDALPFTSMRDLFPSLNIGINKSLSSLVWSFFKQGFFKQLLTEGERYIMTIFSVISFADQGVYDVINNLGSLAARFVFLPIEDSAYLLFTQSLTRGRKIKEQDPDMAQFSSLVLESLLKGVSLLGLTILVFGYAYSYLLLDIYGGDILSSGSGPMLLRVYCMYVLLIAINGVSEGFVFATMKKEEVDRYNRMLLCFSVIFLFSSWYLTVHLGSLGFILANCLNMIARIAHSLHYMSKYYKGSPYTPWRAVMPPPAVLVVYAASFLITIVSENLLLRQAGWINRCIHIGIGGVCLTLAAGTVYIAEYKLMTFIKLQYNRKTV